MSLRPSGYETVHEKFSALRMIAQNYDKSLILLDIFGQQPSIGFEAARGDFRPHVSMVSPWIIGGP
ncbi:MAG: hypothetical protein V6Z86_03575 [Hyphomicrobiales bacterium]